MVKNKPEARLENWEIIGGGRTPYALAGDVFGSPKFKEGVEICTSPIVKLDIPQEICETKNTVYKLGKRNGL